MSNECKIPHTFQLAELKSNTPPATKSSFNTDNFMLDWFQWEVNFEMVWDNEVDQI